MLLLTSVQVLLAADAEDGNGLLGLEVSQGEVAAGTERLRHEGRQVLGVAIASLAGTGLAAGTASPAVGFGLFLMVFGGLYLAVGPMLRTRSDMQ
jgi:hypothetical protein